MIWERLYFSLPARHSMYKLQIQHKRWHLTLDAFCMFYFLHSHIYFMNTFMNLNALNSEAFMSAADYNLVIQNCFVCFVVLYKYVQVSLKMFSST